FYLIFSKIEKPDVIIGSTVHPFAAFFGCITAKFFKVPHVFEIRDLWPETFIDMNVWNRDSLISSFFYAVESFTVKRSSAFIVLSPMTTEYLVNRYEIQKEKVLLLPNGVNESFYNKKPSMCSSSVVGKITIKYVGGLDSVHGLDFLIDIAQFMSDDYNIVLVGDGKDKKRLVAKAESLRLKNVTFLEPVPKNEVPNVLSDSDLLFLSTADVFYGSENKLYEYMSSAKPIIVASNASHNNPVIDLDCGLVLNRDDIFNSSVRLKDYIAFNYNNFNEIGLRGRNYVIENRTIPMLSKQLLDFLNEIQI
ncbi:glycosyltransferase family 4 protein, partial [Vibrio vulnificus]|nr:glycosyltransferase family 4 protein [Vibrio vulnificus]